MKISISSSSLILLPILFSPVQSLPFSISPSTYSPLSFLSSIFPTFNPVLLQTQSDEPPFWSTEAYESYLRFRGINFIDITDHQHLGELNAARFQSSNDKPASFPSKAVHKDQVKQILKDISEKGPREHLEKFTGFYNRYYKSDNGRLSQKWLYGVIDKIISNSSIPDITLKEFDHPWAQNSIILHIPGSDKKLTEEKGVTILGAHLDSTAFISFMRAPGADDDASGVVTLLETLRLLFQSSFTPSSSLEFHFYSAEEGGLLGSQAIASSYESSSKKVYAMLQQDMTAYVKPNTKERAGLVSDFTSPALTEFISMLVESYTYLEPVQTKLGYAASDHASWFKIGVPSAFAVEAPYDDCNLRNIHTSGDRFDIEDYSFNHLLEFVKLSSGFAVELTA